MNINTNSWHYKLVKEFTFRDSMRGQVPTSLCPYMRAVMYRVLFLTVVLGGLGTMLTAMGWPIGLAAMGALGFTVPGGIIGLGATGVISFLAMTGIFATIIGIAVGAGFCVAKIAEKVGKIRREKFYAQLEKERQDRANGILPPEPGLLKAWFSAKHDAVCPTLNFVKPEVKEEK